MFHPAKSFAPLLESLGPEESPIREYWNDLVVRQQRDVMIAAAATAVGINMTFMFPYTMLRKGWTKEFRGLSIFDLSTGMFIPYILATGCVVIASASRFHGQVAEGFVLEEKDGQIVRFEEPDMSPEALSGLSLNDRNRLKGVYSKYANLIAKREGADLEGELSDEERRVAATLVKRDAMNLAKSLSPLTGDIIANYVFGLGVLAMVLSTISILMLISGFVFTEVLALPERGWGFRVGTLFAGLGGMLGPFIWGTQNAQFYLAVPTSVFGFILLPFAYVTFVLVLNSQSLLGDERPRGFKRFVWTVLTVFAATVASVGALIMLWYKAKVMGIVAVGAFVFLAAMVAVNRYNTARQKQTSEEK
jgi:hypothetical protein